MWLKFKDKRINFKYVTEYSIRENIIVLERQREPVEIEFENEEEAKEAVQMIDDCLNQLEAMVYLQMFFRR